MTPSELLALLLTAANAKTDEEKARVAWRASDYMWSRFPESFSLAFCRGFNNLLQDQHWPWVKDLWSQEEVEHVLRWNMPGQQAEGE